MWRILTIHPSEAIPKYQRKADQSLQTPVPPSVRKDETTQDDPDMSRLSRKCSRGSMPAAMDSEGEMTGLAASLVLVVTFFENRYGTERMRQKLLVFATGVLVSTSIPLPSVKRVNCGTQLIGGLRLNARSSA